MIVNNNNDNNNDNNNNIPNNNKYVRIKINFSKGNNDMKRIGKTAKYYRKNPEAYKKKLEKDKEINARPEQIEKRVDCNRKRREAIKKGKDIKGLDYDHATKRFIDPSKNRGRKGEGNR